MKNASTIKSSKIDSPKTPGGISKSLLTPCRRIGLSRKIRKSGALPFQSPLSSNTEVKLENVETRKRKESLEETPQTPQNDECDTSEVIKTPTRNVELPRRKKSKTLLTSITKSAEENELPETTISAADDKTLTEIQCEHTVEKNIQNISNEEVKVSTPVRLKSRSKSKKKSSPSKSLSKETPAIDFEKENSDHHLTTEDNKSNNKTKNNSAQKETKEKCPNTLTKECTVVIQKKIFKNELKDIQKPKTKEELTENTEKPKDKVSQTLFDSDSDDVPLIKFNKGPTTKTIEVKSINENDDFMINKTRISKSDSKSLNSKPKCKSLQSTKNKNVPKVANVEVHKPNSQSSEDDDDFFETKRTILIRKSYNKVIKPQKAKSTGSITQKDIDDLRARIETKKKLLLARAMTEDTKELRDLIKKWQKGCQDALMELMDLMKSKFPDKQHMDYSEILQTLKIPASLVGYDSDNDSFVTPDDENIILANVKD